MKASSAFPARLAWWRKRRGLSQFRLATAAACSQRHLSFLELGRTKPSREMVLRLSAALDMPLRQANELLLAAGYAPAWSEADLGAAALAPIRSALDYMLSQQEPFPAVVVDRRWNLLQANKGAVAMVEFLVGPLEARQPRSTSPTPWWAPTCCRPHLTNWTEVVRYFVRSVEADAAVDGTAQTGALLQRLLGYPGVRAAMAQADAVRRRRPRAADAVPEGADGPQAVHDHRHARHAARRHAAGAAGRELLSDGRRDRDVFRQLAAPASRLLRSVICAARSIASAMSRWASATSPQPRKLHPLAGLEVLVVDEEVLDLVARDLGQVGVGLHVDVALGDA